MRKTLGLAGHMRMGMGMGQVGQRGKDKRHLVEAEDNRSGLDSPSLVQKGLAQQRERERERECDEMGFFI